MKTRKFSITPWIMRLVLWVACAVTVMPILFVFNSSISTTTSLFSSSLLPQSVTLQNYINLFAETDFLGWLKTTLITSIGGSLLGLVLTLTMGYAFSRFQFPGRRYGLLVLIMVQMIPSAVMIVAIYRILLWLGLLNHNIGLILVYSGITIPVNAWLMRGYFNSISREIEEAAYIDGATRFGAFLRIALPLASPMIAVVFIFNLISFYNDYLFASIVMLGRDHYTVALGLRFFNAPYAANWSMFAAASIIACLPVAVIFYALQRYLVEGLTRGAMKG
jgi:arabinogalactan oligomer/maltooligosaccharide transport system permease protein